MLAQLFNIIAPVLFCAGLGFAWKKAGAPFDSETVTAVATNIGAPCLILATLTRLQVGLDVFGEMALAAGAALGIFMILAAVVLRLIRLPAHTFLPALVLCKFAHTKFEYSKFAPCKSAPSKVSISKITLLLNLFNIFIYIPFI
ncbi:MAG: hypothetical protein ABFS30_09105 [Pseudomonadota bacterium]